VHLVNLEVCSPVRISCGAPWDLKGPEKNRCSGITRRSLTRAALFWRGLQSRDREGATEAIDFFKSMVN